MGIIDLKAEGAIKEAGGAIKDIFSGIGTMAIKIRTAITGKVDPETAAMIERQVAELEAAAQMAQVEVNKIEAASQSVFVAGWRPFIGWVCGGSMAAYYIPQALVAAGVWCFQCIYLFYHTQDPATVVIPAYPLLFDMNEILGLLGALLGLGWYRSYDKKVAGAAK
jgi:hypothetical protein